MSSGLGNKDGKKLESFVDRIERLNGEIDDLNADKKEVYTEAEEAGFDKKALKDVIQARRKRAKDPAKFQEQLDLFDDYMLALDGHPKKDDAKKPGPGSKPAAKKESKPATEPAKPDAFAQGREAHDAGKPDKDNPYGPKRDKTKHQSWNNGWTEGWNAADKEAASKPPAPAGDEAPAAEGGADDDMTAGVDKPIDVDMPGEKPKEGDAPGAGEVVDMSDDETDAMFDGDDD